VAVWLASSSHWRGVGTNGGVIIMAMVSVSGRGGYCHRSALVVVMGVDKV